MTYHAIKTLKLLLLGFDGRKIFTRQRALYQLFIYLQIRGERFISQAHNRKRESQPGAPAAVLHRRRHRTQSRSDVPHGR